MSTTSQIPLEIDLGNHIVTRYVEWWNEGSRFVVVKFSRDGQPMEMGLRYDLDKRTFLDDTGEPESDRKLDAIAPEIWKAVVHYRSSEHRSQAMTHVQA